MSALRGCLCSGVLCDIFSLQVLCLGGQLCGVAIAWQCSSVCQSCREPWLHVRTYACGMAD